MNTVSTWILLLSTSVLPGPCRGCGTSCMVEVAEAAVVISSLRWKEVVRGKIRHRRSRGRGRSGLALIPLGWREQQRLPGSWTSHVSTSGIKALVASCLECFENLLPPPPLVCFCETTPPFSLVPVAAPIRFKNML